MEILEADTFKHAEMKEKIKNKKNTSAELKKKNYWKPNYIEEISSKG